MRLIRKLTYLSILSLFITFLGRCTKTDSANSIPSYIEVEEFYLSTSSIEGTDSHRISDAWVFVNDNLMGVFELPARVPTLATGEQNVKIFAGIKRNGQSDDRIRYPFYTHFDGTVDLIPDSTVLINPTIGYIDDLDIWEENFEDGGISFTKTVLSDTNFAQDNSDPFEGSKSGVVSFGPDDLFFEARTNEPSFDNFPKVGQPVYLELNYRSNNSFVFGIYNNDGSLPADAQLAIFTFSPKEYWNKTYINLTDAVSGLSSANKFDIYFSAFNNGETAIPKIEMDNIKIVF